MAHETNGGPKQSMVTPINLQNNHMQATQFMQNNPMQATQFTQNFAPPSSFNKSPLLSNVSQVGAFRQSSGLFPKSSANNKIQDDRFEKILPSNISLSKVKQPFNGQVDFSKIVNYVRLLAKKRGNRLNINDPRPFQEQFLQS